jgi:hypothetical protein
MSQSAFLKLVEGSTHTSVSLEELKQLLLRYQEQLALTGKQLAWGYEEAAFPYTIETRPEGEGKWFYLKGTSSLYNYILVGIGSEKIDDDTERSHVQVVLPDNATHGDKSKGNELCKHLGKQLKAELHLFNGRVMYFNPRK